MRLALLLALALTLAGCPSLESFYRGRDKVVATVDVAYLKDDVPKHRLDVYRPRGAKGPFPIVVFVHGGYWRGGDKTYWQAITGLYGNVGVALGELGVGAVVTSYRLFPAATVDDMLDDVVAALDWTRLHATELGADPTRIVLAGHSAGGHLVTLLGAHPELLRARGLDPTVLAGVVGISGIYDLPSTIAAADDDMRAELYRPLFSDDAERQRATSPLFAFGPEMTPTLFVVGSADYASCLRDYAAAEARLAPLVGERAWFRRIDGNTHEDMVLEIGTVRDEVAPAIAAFAKRAARGLDVKAIAKRDARTP